MKIKKGDLIDEPYRFESIYTRGYFVVEERDGQLGINILTDRKGWYDAPNDAYEWRPVRDDMKIIGNIDENPELLKDR